MFEFKRISIITGHYGSGKTNVAVNLAYMLAKTGKKVTIVDLDIVNPYFRTSDFKEALTKKGITVIAPIFANTNLDIPALPASINSIFDNREAASYVIIDVGGDDAGAIALGRYSNFIKNDDYDMFYVINENRYQTKNAEEALVLLNEIEACARVKATQIINNSNLGSETTLEIVKHSLPFAKEVSELSGLPVAFTAILENIENPCGIESDSFLPMELYVKPFYQE